MKAPNGYHMTADTAGKPLRARTLTGRCRTHASTARHLQAGLKTSGVAYSASRMTMSKIHAPEIPTVLYWVGSPPWARGQWRSSPNRQQLSRQHPQQHPGRFAGVLTRGGATSSNAANTFTAAPPAMDHTLSSNAPTATYRPQPLPSTQRPAGCP